MNIAGQFFGVFILFDHNRLVAALKQMAVSRPFDIEVGRVSAVDMMHDLGKIAGHYASFESHAFALSWQSGTSNSNRSLVTMTSEALTSTPEQI